LSELKILLGLGNPGRQYHGTRHNLGFEWIDGLAERWKAQFRPYKELGLLAEADTPHGPVWLAKPETYMNLSGKMAAELVRRKGGGPAGLLVGYDDHALPLGQLRLRLKGSAGGHNGMSSVIEHVGTQDIPRMRLGIGPLPKTGDPVSFVLGRFAPSERPAKDAMIARACDATEKALADGLLKAMTAFNTAAGADA
jgi:PTH1 family peptidyl-tRNA hydrolase